MAASAGLVGLAIALTLAAGFGLARYEKYATYRGFRHTRFNRPGGMSLLVGTGFAALLPAVLDRDPFMPACVAIAAISAIPVLRKGGRLPSFVLLFVFATAAVVALDAELPAFGTRPFDVLLTAFILTCFTSLLREFDAAGSIGWAAALAAATGVGTMCAALSRSDDTVLMLLFAGALFAVLAAAPFGAGMLGRQGSRLAGLVIGGIAVRAAAGTPNATAAVLLIGIVCVLAYVMTLEKPYRGYAWGVVFGTTVACSVGAVPAALALRDVYNPVNDAVARSRALVRVNPSDGLQNASANLASVEKTFRDANRKLTAPAVLPSRFIPVLGANMRAATTSSSAAADLALSARRLLDRVNVGSVSFAQGQIAENQLDQLGDGLRAVNSAVIRARGRVVTKQASDLLVPELRDAVDDLRGQLNAVGGRVRTSLDGTVTAKRLLGFGGGKRYFVAVQNNAESRATGGYIANYGILAAQNGRVTLPDFRRTNEFDKATDKPRVLRAPKTYVRRYSQFDVDRNWTNVNLSPDFPTVGAVITDQYKQFSDVEVDGVIAIDPIGLAELIKLSGPVTVAPWPVPITSANAVQILLHDEYLAFQFSEADRTDFLGRVARQVFNQLTDRGLTDLVKASGVIAEITRQRHLQFWTRDAFAASFFRHTKVDGAVAPLAGDAVLVTTQNAAANKVDYYLRRGLNYEATVRPVNGGVAVDGTLAITLQNTAPSKGEPAYIIGPFDSRFQPGQNRTFLTVYSPFEGATATIDGKPLPMTRAPEFGRWAYSAFVDVLAGATRTIEFKAAGLLAGSAQYRLDLRNQPMVVGDTYGVLIKRGDGTPAAQASGVLDRDVRLVVRTPRQG